MQVARTFILLLLVFLAPCKGKSMTPSPLHFLAYTKLIRPAFQSLLNQDNLAEEPLNQTAELCSKLLSLSSLSPLNEEECILNFSLNHQLMNANIINKRLFSKLFPQICLRPESKNFAMCECKVLSIAARNDNEFAATTADGFVFRWEMNSQTINETLEGVIDFIAIDQDTVFFVRKQSCQVEFFSWNNPDLRSYSSLTHDTHRGKITLLTLIPEQNKLFVGDGFGCLSTWSSITKKCLLYINTKQKALSALTVKPESELFISTGWDAVISTVDPVSKKLSQLVLINTKAMIKRMFFTTADTLLYVDLLGTLRTLTIENNKVSNTTLIDKIETISPFPYMANTAVLINRMNTVLFLHIQPGPQKKAVTYPLFNCVHEPTALCVSENGLIITGHQNGSILVDYSLRGLFSLHPFQLKLLLLLQQHKDTTMHVTLSLTWFMIFLSLPDTYQEQFYDILSQQSKADLLEYKLCHAFTKRKN